jgi:hypothetical protein
VYNVYAGVRQQILIVRWGIVALVLVAALFWARHTWGQSSETGKAAGETGTQPVLSDSVSQSAVSQNESAPLANKTAQGAASTLLYSSYIGGDGVDYGKDVAVDAAGNIYVLGQTFSDTLFDEEIERAGYSDIFVAKFDPTGSNLLWSSVIGGNDSESPMSIAVDAQGNVYGTTFTSDDTFPTQNALWPAPPESTNGVLFKLDSDGQTVYSTYLPMDVFYSRHDLAVDKEGNVYVTGTYPWVMKGDTLLRDQIGLLKFDPTGTEVLLDVQIGGNGTDRGVAIALDDGGNIYLAGTTSEGDGFPVTANAHQPECGDLIYEPDSYCYEDTVVVVLDPAGEVTYSSYHGGSFTDEPNAIGTDGKGNVMIAGDTASSRFPFVNAIQDTCQIASYSDDCESGRPYVSVIHINANNPNEKATLVYSTYLGATERNSANTVLSATMDRSGNAYITGYTSGKKFPLANAVQDELYESFCYTFSSERYCFDAFVAKLSPAGELLMGTYLGADFDEYPYGLAVDSKGTIYVAGTTEASDFLTTDNAYEPSNLINDDAFLVKIGMSTNTPPSRPVPAPLGVMSLPRMAFLHQ